jgi:hypothetical protein
MHSIGVISMSRASPVKKTNIKRGIQAVLAAGLGVASIDINKDGGFTIVPGKPATPVKADQINENAAIPDALDRELVEFEERHGQG